MLLNLEIHEKDIGQKVLYKGLSISISEGEKIGLIGRNGTGKSTLLNMIAGLDKDYDGQIELDKYARIASTRQEHIGLGEIDLITYILDDLPEFKSLKRAMASLTSDNPSPKQLEDYTNALERFTVLGYFEVEDRIREDLKRLQFSQQMIDGRLKDLSGGQKRLVEVVKIMNSGANLVLMDEPTNHMDHIAKKWFVDWLNGFNGATLIVTHDRDVLHVVDKIAEIKDLTCRVFKGNYDAYLKQNTHSTVNSIQGWELTQKTIENLRSKVIKNRRLKEKARDPGTIKVFKRLENQAQEELEKLELLVKPTFWIDKENSSGLKKDVASKYDEYKTKNINVQTNNLDASSNKLLQIEDLSLGYGSDPLFEGISLNVGSTDRYELRGRNGVGKSTLVKSIVSTYDQSLVFPGKVFAGLIDLAPQTKIGLYEQELEADYLKLNVEEAVYSFYDKLGQNITDQNIRSILSNYLFDPSRDLHQRVANLSGGQKARLQLVKMFANEPNLLILDEPTNHLDLPSIEELEEALKNYQGAILYVSHDTYFCKNIVGEVLEIGK
jgi:ATP-binding cassette subfamily F protein 3